MENMDGRVGVIRPTFEEYPNRLDNERVVAFVPQNKDYRYGVNDLMDYFADCDIQTLLLINPDNPSGNFIPLTDICMLADWCEKKIN